MPIRPFWRQTALVAAALPLLAVGAGAPTTAFAGPVTNPSAVALLPPAAWQDPQKGVVLLSTAAAGPCKTGGLWIHFFDPRKKSLVDGLPFVPVDLLEHSDFEGHYGALSAVSLPPGEYAAVVTFTTPWADTTSAPAFAFEVFAGEVTYLGTVRKHGGCNSNSPSFDVIDRHAADIEAATTLAKDPKGPARAVTRLMESL
jgi:hypothetical protein